MKLHVDPTYPTIILDEQGNVFGETGLQAGYQANVEHAAEMVARWNAAENRE
jgi:hypothetical protein